MNLPKPYYDEVMPEDGNCFKGVIIALLLELITAEIVWIIYQIAK
jgi:hypothetical protein